MVCFSKTEGSFRFTNKPFGARDHVNREVSFQPKEEWEILGQAFGMSRKYHLDFFV